MLLRYSVSNFLSFKKMNTLQMIAGKSEDFKEQTFKDMDSNISILKSGVIYGANASGKSNFIKSIDFAKALIIGGLERINTFDKNFRLDEEYRKKPSLFQFEIKIGKKYYDYGFSIILNSKKIVEEWLYEKKISGEELCIFYRKDNKVLERIKLNESNESKFNIYISDIKDDIFILKEFSLKKWEENELDSIKNIFTWFVKNLEIIFPDDREGIFYFMNKYKELENYLADFDTGIEVVDLQEKDFETWIKDIPESIKINIQNQLIEMEKDFLEKEKTKKISEKAYGGIMVIIQGVPYIIEAYEDKKIVKILNFKHLKETNELFKIVDESDGTKRLVELIPLFHNLTAIPKTLIIDEIDRSFHPALTRKLFEIFFRTTKGKESQLIATTHDTNLLDLNFFRKDEIFFVDRDRDKSSEIYSLDEFKELQESKAKNIEKEYFWGRYGGVPIFGEFHGSDKE